MMGLRERKGRCSGYLKATNAANGVSGWPRKQRSPADWKRRGCPRRGLTAGRLHRRVLLSVLADAVVILGALVVIITGGSGQAVDWDARYGTARGLPDRVALKSWDQLRVYQRAALRCTMGKA